MKQCEYCTNAIDDIHKRCEGCDMAWQAGYKLGRKTGYEIGWDALSERLRDKAIPFEKGESDA